MYVCAPHPSPGVNMALIELCLTSQNFKPPAQPGQQSSTPAPASGTASPIPQIAMGRGGFLQQQQSRFGAGPFPLNAVATPPFFSSPGPGHHHNNGGYMQQNWRNR